MIKIACCISGRPSSRILDHLKFLVKYKSQMDFFIFFWDVIDNFTKDKINSLIQPKETLYMKPITFSFDAVFKEPDKPDNKNNALSMFYGISRVQQLRQSFEQKTNKRYDVVIRFRYDIQSFSELDDITKQASKILDQSTLIFPFERHHIGICDQIWFGRSRTMDRFSDLFNWIRDNINTLFFVNENVLYKFIEANNLNIKCLDIKYVLRRDNMIDVPHHVLWSEYIRDQNLPWVLSCPEKKEGHYQTYIANKNESANNIYFFTKNITTPIPSNYCMLNRSSIRDAYSIVPCKILNCVRNKYIYVSEKNYFSCITGGNIYTHFFIRPCNAYLINILIDNHELTHGVEMCLTVNNDKIIATTNLNDINSQFMLIKKGNSYLFAQHQSVENLSAHPNTVGVNCKRYLFMNKNLDIMADGDKNNPEVEWKIIV